MQKRGQRLKGIPVPPVLWDNSISDLPGIHRPHITVKQVDGADHAPRLFQLQDIPRLLWVRLAVHQAVKGLIHALKKDASVQIGVLPAGKQGETVLPVPLLEAAENQPVRLQPEP